MFYVLQRILSTKTNHWLAPEGKKLWSGELNVVDDESETLEVRISYILYFTFYSVNKPRGDELIG